MGWFGDWLKSLITPTSANQPYKASPQRWYIQVIQDLKLEEGCSLTAYWDDVGKCWTIGYGHTSDEHGLISRGMKITQQEAEQFLKDDVDEAVASAKRIFKSFDTMDWVRKTVVVNMAYELGGDGLSKFVETIKAIDSGDYQAAALRMMNSLWARQVKGRATTLSNRMRTGMMEIHV